MNIVKETKHQFDPALMVTVVDVTKGVAVDTLHYNLRDKDRTMVSCDPSFEEYGDPIYRIPRFYAERLLANTGGRTHLLVDPVKLTIRVPNGRAGTSLKELIACRKRADGNWYPMTEDELNGIDKEDVSEIPATTQEPKRVKGVSKKATTKPVVAIKSEDDGIEFEEPTLGDVLGN